MSVFIQLELTAAKKYHAMALNECIGPTTVYNEESMAVLTLCFDFNLPKVNNEIQGRRYVFTAQSYA